MRAYTCTTWVVQGTRHTPGLFSHSIMCSGRIFGWVDSGRPCTGQKVCRCPFRDRGGRLSVCHTLCDRGRALPGRNKRYMKIAPAMHKSGAQKDKHPVCVQMPKHQKTCMWEASNLRDTAHLVLPHKGRRGRANKKKQSRCTERRSRCLQKSIDYCGTHHDAVGSPFFLRNRQDVLAQRRLATSTTAAARAREALRTRCLWRSFSLFSRFFPSCMQMSASRPQWPAPNQWQQGHKETINTGKIVTLCISPQADLLRVDFFFPPTRPARFSVNREGGARRLSHRHGRVQQDQIRRRCTH